MSTRRDFLRATAGFGLTVPLVLAGCNRPAADAPAAPSATAADAGDPWANVEAILARIQPPTFPDREFPVTEHGAVGDGTTDCTDAFRAAVDACHEAGGGRVVVPAGTFLTGPIHLRSNVNLHLDAAAVVLFDRDPARYLPAVFTRWEGVELMNYSPLIYAFDQENVAVTGTGTLDGQADDAYWWPWKGQTQHGWTEGTPHQQAARDRLFALAEDGVPVEERVFGEGDYLRPQFIQPYRCRNVLIEGVTIRRSPMWEVHPVLCTNVTVRGLTVETHGPNNDGCDPESCTDVLIEGCLFDTGDDCIAIKSGRNADGRRVDVPSSNIVIRDCEMKDGHGGVTIGSEISGGASHIYAERCRMDSPNLDRALRIKTNSVRGGVVEDVYLRDIEIGQVGDAVVRVNFLYEEGDAGEFTPVVRRIDVRRTTSERSRRALYLRGYDHAPITDITLVDCAFDNVEEESIVENVEGLVMRNVRINGDEV